MGHLKTQTSSRHEFIPCTSLLVPNHLSCSLAKRLVVLWLSQNGKYGAFPRLPLVHPFHSEVGRYSAFLSQRWSLFRASSSLFRLLNLYHFRFESMESRGKVFDTGFHGLFGIFLTRKRRFRQRLLFLFDRCTFYFHSFGKRIFFSFV